ncbi:MAG: ROK family transcriptional regulator [Eubacteriales bacterium]|nr:ROK family transcriptional regulator [Eubacteriales bacterium]
MLTGSHELIRDINTQSVIRTIIVNGAISRASIATKLGLTKATVSAIVQVLLDRDIILETGSDDTKKGRKPILLQLNKNCGYVIAIDLGDNSINLMTANIMGENCHLTQFSLPSSGEDLVSYLTQYIDNAICSLPDSRYGLLGISLGIHGVVHHNKIIFLPYSSYKDIDFVSILEEKYKVPVVMENEANLSVLGEWAHCHNTNEMIYISVHSGIGIGIIMRNQLVKGKNGYAGEFGHTIIEIDGRPCPCGNLGCLEQYASERALFSDLSRELGFPVDVRTFGELYRQENPRALQAVRRFIKYMAIGINNLLNTFNPDIIVLNSSLNMYHPSLCEDIMAELHNTMKQYCHLVPSALQDTSILLGGIYMIRERFLYPNQI